MAAYQLGYVDFLRRAIGTLDIEAATDFIATELAAEHSVQSNSTVEVWLGEAFVIRVTPMTAQLLKLEKGFRL